VSWILMSLTRLNENLRYIISGILWLPSFCTRFYCYKKHSWR